MQSESYSKRTSVFKQGGTADNTTIWIFMQFGAMNGNEQIVWVLDIFLDLNDSEIQPITFKKPDLKFYILFS